MVAALVAQIVSVTAPHDDSDVADPADGSVGMQGKLQKPRLAKRRPPPLTNERCFAGYGDAGESQSLPSSCLAATIDRIKSSLPPITQGAIDDALVESSKSPWRTRKRFADPNAVYTRLSNFAARYRKITIGHDANANDAAASPKRADPLTPYLGPGRGLDFFDLCDLPSSRGSSPKERGHNKHASQSPIFLSERSIKEPETDGILEGECSTDETDDRDEQERIKGIEQELEAMNDAAAELNAAQVALNKHTQDRETLDKRWAVTSARMSRSFGASLLAKAKPYYEDVQVLEDARQAAEVATMRFLAAAGREGCTEVIDKLTSEHARCLSEFQKLQARVGKAQKTCGLSPAVLDALAPYFEYEQEFRERCEETDEALKRCKEQVAITKARYVGALRNLEALSEEAHQRRSAQNLEGSEHVTLTSERSGSRRIPSHESEIPPASAVDSTGEGGVSAQSGFQAANPMREQSEGAPRRGRRRRTTRRRNQCRVRSLSIRFRQSVPLCTPRSDHAGLFRCGYSADDEGTPITGSTSAGGIGGRQHSASTVSDESSSALATCTPERILPPPLPLSWQRPDQ